MFQYRLAHALFSVKHFITADQIIEETRDLLHSIQKVLQYFKKKISCRDLFPRPHPHTHTHTHPFLRLLSFLIYYPIVYGYLNDNQSWRDFRMPITACFNLQLPFHTIVRHKSDSTADISRTFFLFFCNYHLCAYHQHVLRTCREVKL